MDLKKLTITELINYKDACKTICEKYEKDAMAYSDYIRNGIQLDSNQQEQWKLFNGIYNKILAEIESRLKELK